ncbi:potassium channel family protein [Lederbergia citrea]|uniref:Two pore domain potassium channel family protein n=1 Tax=Lederbergia citrea TaxID=2833581 RepID=A0A942URE3_9BACI|nr:potassium channel family protein [Lederbergia citrea]MBS4179109.1 two pore domain potassium channel family protein [Lederbergia citrea]MBS4205769.1 two pore domain potassium channel family protein [Lederbergia citrea]MBS4224782.1 two pore domain potassium channel family protein [Lederbergia citrea]
MWYIIFFAIVVCIFMALKNLFFPERFNYKQVSFENFVFLAFTYAVIVIGFGLLFLMFEIRGWHLIIDSGAIMSGSWNHQLGTALYLSAITLFSVGYGDVVPIGIGRLLVMIEALIGYTIPAAFVVRTFIDYEPAHRQKK